MKQHPFDFKQFEKRKAEHIKFALADENQATGLSGLDTLHLAHEAIPDLDFNEVTLSTYRLGNPTPTPFLVSAMTAGHKQAIEINRRLMQACQEKNWVMGVGSQRRQLNDSHAALEWRTLRQATPNVVLYGNLGLAQLIMTPITDLERLIESLQAEAMIIHCNPLQECIQPEGTPQFKGSWQALESLCKQLSVPVIVKETGCGFSYKTLKRLNTLGVAAVDLSGLGGTHWGRIEGDRTVLSQQQQTAKTFRNWGISTVEALSNAIKLNPSYEIWASGGIRSGLDAAKLLAFGAQTIGLAKPLLQAALNGTEAIIDLMNTVEYELKTALFCTGNANIQSFTGDV